MKNVAAFAYRGELPAAGLPGDNLPGRSMLFAKLYERDLRPVVTRHAEAAFTPDAIKAAELIEEDGLSKIGEVALLNVGVIVSRLGRSFRGADKAPNLPDRLPPVINENATRSLAFRKIRAHREVLEPLGIAIPTTLVTAGADIDAFTQMYTADRYFVKPDSGTNSNGVSMIGAVDLKDRFANEGEWYGKQLLQSAYDFSIPFPSDLRPYDTHSGEAYQGWAGSDYIKELRMYGFHSPAGTTTFPVARAIAGGDQWFFVDGDTVSSVLHEKAGQAMNKVAEVTGATAVYGTVDFGYGVPYGDTQAEPEWKAIEMNARTPYMIDYAKHAGVADKLRELFADQIQATAYAA